jgi:hypothetical protein
MATLKALSEQAGVRGVVIDNHDNAGEAWVTLKLDDLTALAERASRYEAALREIVRSHPEAPECPFAVIARKALEKR